MLVKLEFSREIFEKITQILSFMKIRRVEAELLHEDGQTDGRKERHHEANSRFLKFCEQA